MKSTSATSRSTSRRTPASGGKTAARPSLRAQGERTRQLIVKAATRLLLEGGGFDFTLRAVAREAKIGVSNLQYYFPDRRELLRAVMAPVVESYLADLGGGPGGDAPPREMVARLVERWLQDARDPRKMSLMWQFASLAGFDPECRRLFEECYEALVGGVARLIERISPEFGAADSRRCAAMLVAMTDGLGFQMRAAAGRGAPYLRELDDSLRMAVEAMLERNLFRAAGRARGGKRS